MISERDIPGFFASPSELNLEDYVVLKYVFQTGADPRLAAASLCSEQSTAQWKRAGVKEDLRERHGAKVVSLEAGSGSKSYTVQIAHPHRNFGPRLPNFLSAAAGEGPFYCPAIETIKWLDFQMPKALLQSFEGPLYGLPGIREILGVKDRPFLIGVVKPNLGLSPRDFAELAYESWVGGLDIAKDDEMLGDMEWSPLKERAFETGRARKKAEEKTGLKKIYLASITDEVDRLLPLRDLAVKEGANAVMINGIFTGLSAVKVVSRKSPVPVMSHFTGTACLSRPADFGISSLVLTKLQRLGGADMIGLAGFGERMRSPDEEVKANIEACLKPWGFLKAALPIPGGSDWAGTLPTVFAKIGHPDFGFISGRGIFGHPQGPASGAKSLQEAWEAVQKGVSLEEYARNHEALRTALATFR